jgi:hypothetical protein
MRLTMFITVRRHVLSAWEVGCPGVRGYGSERVWEAAARKMCVAFC